MRLIVSGDSFTYGQGLGDPARESYPARIAEHLGSELINFARPGAGNTWIANSIVDHVHREGDLYLIVWSHWSRLDLMTTDGVLEHICYGSRVRRELHDLFFKEFYNEAYLYKKYLNTVLLLQAYLRDKDYLMIDAFKLHDVSDVNEELISRVDKQRYFGFSTTENLVAWTGKDHRLTCGHFNKEGCEVVANKLYRYLLNSIIERKHSS
jgi:hypothetical protein